MKLSVCIVNFNSISNLTNCIKAIYAKNIRFSHEIIVVDNGSIDDSIHSINKYFPKIVLIENINNVGYTKAMNTALKNSSGEYALLLNPDAIIKSNYIESLVSFMESDNSIGVCGPKVLNVDGSFQKSCRRGIAKPLAVFSYFLNLKIFLPNDTRLTEYHLDHLSPDQINDVSGVSGSCMIIRSNLFKTLGFLDELFFAYQEDSDFCLRVINHGSRVVYNPEIVVNHIGGEGGSRTYPMRAIFEWHRSYFYFYNKYFKKDYSLLFNSFYYTVMFMKLIYSEMSFLIRKK